MLALLALAFSMASVYGEAEGGITEGEEVVDSGHYPIGPLKTPAPRFGATPLHWWHKVGNQSPDHLVQCLTYTA